MKLYVIRHGQTDWNARRVMQGSVEIPLNEEGLRQARVTKDLLAPLSLDRVFVSPQTRARQTAETITAGRDLPVTVAAELRERGYGAFEGKSASSFDYYAFWDFEKDLHGFEVEPIRAFFDRVWAFLEDLKERYPEERILLVTHGGVVRAVECYAHPEKKNDQLGRWLPKNCFVYEYDL